VIPFPCAKPELPAKAKSKNSVILFISLRTKIAIYFISFYPITNILIVTFVVVKMFPVKSHIIAFLIALVMPIVMNGQMEVSQTSGCVPLAQVNFKNATAGDWDFGDGGGVIAFNKDSVVHSYVNAGTYEAILYQGGTTIEIDRQTIDVYNKPSTAFDLTGNSSGCVPLSTSFADASAGGGGVAVVDWKWDFGDGLGSSSEDPNHVFTLVGVFDISLIVTDANGCDSSIVKEKFITVTEAPTSSFTTNPNPANACVGPLTVSFVNSSTNSTGGTTELTYTWDFGNGQTSTDVNPAAVTYTAEGTYVVTLEVVESGGCTVTSSRTVNIGNPVSIPDLPDTVCIGDRVNPFGNLSVGANSYLWSFSGVPIYTSKNPSHTFNVAGDIQITLKAINSAGCSDDSTVTVYVEDPVVDFARTPTYLCQEPYCFTYDGQTAQTNVASWNWLFGSPYPPFGNTFRPIGISSAEDTTFCFSINDTLYYDHDYYFPIAEVEIVTTNGCIARQSHRDTIYPVSAFFVPDSSMGCAPLTVTFSDSTRSREEIISWEYIFGDGSTSNEQNPKHTFTSAGEYEVILITENTLGCRDTSFPVTILIGAPVLMTFTVAPSTVCVGDSVTFTNTSGSADLDYWHYSTNSNKSSECEKGNVQKWASFDEVGQQDVTFYGNYNGCISSTTQSNAVTVEGPLSSLKYTGLCASPLDYTFIGTIQGADSWEWDFGDVNGIGVSSDSTVSHSYASRGDYTVSLITKNSVNSCGNDTQSVVVNVREITAVISQTDSTLCERVGYNFTGENSTDVFNNCSDAYRWDMGEKTAPRLRGNSEIEFGFPDSGSYTIRLITYDINGCKDTTTKDVRVSKIAAKIGADKLRACLSSDISFSDSSFSENPITNWLWLGGNKEYCCINDTVFIEGYYDNNTVCPFCTAHRCYEPQEYLGNALCDNDTLSFVKDTSLTVDSITKIHPITKERLIQQIRLVVEDSWGCRDTAEVFVTPIIPDTRFSAITDKTICAGDSIQFKANNESAISNFNWTFDGVGTSTKKSPYITFDQADTVDVILSITDTNGCVGQDTVLAYVSIQDYPIAGFDILPEEDTLGIICYEERISFNDTSGGGPVVSWVWDLQTGQPVVDSAKVLANFEDKGIYNVSLEVTTAYGCKDNVISPFELIGPEADFDMSKLIVCSGDEVTFTIKDSSDVAFYLWDFGDGEGMNKVSPVTHTYLNIPTNLKTDIILLLWGEDSICPQKVIKPLEFERVLADFNFPEDTICMNEPFVVVNSSIGADVYNWTVKSKSPSSIIQNSNASDPIISDFSTVGVHELELIIQNNSIGCVDTLIKEFLIHPIPSILARDTGYCEGDLVTLFSISSSSGLIYSWSPVGQLVDPTKATTVAYPDSTTDYTISVTDANNCINSDVANIYIQESFNPIALDSCSNDGKEGVVIGEIVHIGIDKGTEYTYKWEASEADLKWLTCTDCPTQDIKVTEEVGEVNYTLIYTDSLGCFDNELTYKICILSSYSFDVPTAFTPDGDGINDIVYLRGHGITEVITFKIFNRWGELVFESTSMSDGWDGIYKGVAQNMETYIYKAEVRFYNGKTESKGGSLNLIR
jgi:gliding motility-associated-like protein